MSDKNKSEKTVMPFGKQNYILMVVGVLFIVLGLVLLAGGGSDDPTKFNPEIFNTRRMVIAPLLMLTGFVIEFFAIMKKSNNN